MKKIVILIAKEGTGSNLLAIHTAIRKREIDAKIVSVIADSEEAKGLLLAKEHGLPINICKKKNDLLNILLKIAPDFIILAGWKQIITDDVMRTFPNQILNLHPGLIPDVLHGKVQNPDDTEALWNKGLYAELAIKNFLQNKTSYAGSSVHFLSDEFDFGAVLGRTFEKIKKSDTINSLYTRLKKKENALYVTVLKKLCNT